MKELSGRAMPVEQTCPKCGDRFVGSDAVGDMCPNCGFTAVVSTILAAPIVGTVSFEVKALVVLRSGSPVMTVVVQGEAQTKVAWFDETLREVLVREVPTIALKLATNAERASGEKPLWTGSR